MSTMREVAALVAEKHGITLAEIVGPGRERRTCWPRHEAIYLIHGLGKYTLTQIGSVFGNRDHSTVLASVASHKKRLAKAALSTGSRSCVDAAHVHDLQTPRHSCEVTA